MAFNLQNYLLQQSIRMQREDWGSNAQLLGDEIFTILRNIQKFQDTATETDENGNPIIDIDPPDIPDIDIPNFDPPNDPENPIIDPPTVEPQDPNDPGGDPGGGGGQTNVEQQFYHRSSHAGQVLGGSGGSRTVAVYVNGLNESPKSVSATLTDPTADVSDGDWVTVFLVVKYRAISPRVGGQTLPTELETVFVDWHFNSSGPAQGGRIGISGGISGGSTENPGSGSATLYRLDNGSWVPDGSETVFSTVSSDVQAGKSIQLKSVSGKLFVDVEDCEDEEGTGSG